MLANEIQLRIPDFIPLALLHGQAARPLTKRSKLRRVANHRPV